MHYKESLSLITRYGFIIIVGIANLMLAEKGLLYLIFTPLTVYPSYLALNALYGAKLILPNVIFFKGYYATIIPACVAGSAYYLLLILNLTTPMNVKQRMQSLIFIFILFLFLNISRIVLFGSLLFKGYHYFDLAHRAVWYFGSTLLVVLIWFSAVLSFRIEAIPVYTDLRKIMRYIFS